MKHQVLFSLKNNEKIFMNVVCCSPDWRFKDKCCHSGRYSYKAVWQCTLPQDFLSTGILYTILTLKCQTKIAADNIYFFLLYLSKKIRLDFSCESFAKQMIHLKHQVLFSLKNNEKIFMKAVCCSRDWCFKRLK